MLTITPLTPTIGAHLNSLQLGDGVDDESFAAVQQALWMHQVVFLRDQRLSDDDFLAFGKRWGALTQHPLGSKRHPSLSELTIVRADEQSRRVFGEFWHSDQSAQAQPPSVCMLYIKALPETGGDTLWASMYAAYAALSAPMKHLLSGLTAFHNSLKPTSGYVMAPSNAMAHHEHPLVTKHPETGRPALFFSRASVTHIPQLTWAESEALVQFLSAHVEQVKFQCRFRWQKNSIAIWDNRCTNHQAVWDYFPQIREGVRLTVEGAKPVAFDADRTVFSHQAVERKTIG